MRVAVHDRTSGASVFAWIVTLFVATVTFSVRPWHTVIVSGPGVPAAAVAAAWIVTCVAPGQVPPPVPFQTL